MEADLTTNLMDAFPWEALGVLPYASKESPLGSTWILDVCLADYYYYCYYDYLTTWK